MWWLYEALYVLVLLLYLPGALWRRRLPHDGWSMRLGRYPSTVLERLRRSDRPVWIHAVSVGEVLASQPLIHALQAGVRAGRRLVLSTVTPSGFHIASSRLGAHAVPIYLPLDLRPCVRRALDVVQPRALIVMESELWPLLFSMARARGAPVLVANGRMSPRAFARYQRVTPRLRAWFFQWVDAFLMQSDADASRLRELGVPEGRIRVTGNLKWEASLAARPSPELIRQTAARLGLSGETIVIVAGSTHRGEEDHVLQAFRTVRMIHPSARLVVAPRHLERLEEVEALVVRSGFACRRLSQGAGAARWDVGVVDTFGELPRYYGLATVVLIGGSWIPHGGQNPLEASSLGKPVLFGPSMHNFSDIAAQLIAHGAAREVRTGAPLIDTLCVLLADPAEARRMGERAQALIERSRGAIQRTLDAVSPYLK